MFFLRFGVQRIAHGVHFTLIACFDVKILISLPTVAKRGVLKGQLFSNGSGLLAF